MKAFINRRAWLCVTGESKCCRQLIKFPCPIFFIQWMTAFFFIYAFLSFVLPSLFYSSLFILNPPFCWYFCTKFFCKVIPLSEYWTLRNAIPCFFSFIIIQMKTCVSYSLSGDPSVIEMTNDFHSIIFYPLFQCKGICFISWPCCLPTLLILQRLHHIHKARDWKGLIIWVDGP